MSHYVANTLQNTRTPMSVAFEDVEVGIACTPKDISDVLALRKRIYVDEYGWVTSDTGFEVDEYDADSIPLYVKYKGQIIGTIRATDPEAVWMGEASYDGAFLEDTLKVKKNTRMKHPV